MQTQDCRGVPLSGGNRAAAARLERATELLARFDLDPLAEVDALLAEEPGLVMGHCLRAALMLLSTDKACEGELAASLAAAEALAPRANDRERGHMAALRAWLAGGMRRAGDLYGRVLLDHPRDLLALQLAHQCDFFTGRSSMLRDRVAWVLPHWGSGTPGFGFVLGMHAFGLEETNLYARAEEQGRRALSLDARDPWAIHAVAHVMEMEGRAEEGIAWLAGRQADWAGGNMLAFHNWWHLALFHMDRGEHARVLELYDAGVRPDGAGPVPMEMLDASALLWRLHLRGVAVGDRWARLADGWAAVEPGHYAFNDAHAVLALTAAGRPAEAEAVAGALRRAAGAAAGDNARMSRAVGLPLAEAVMAFGRGDYAAATATLLGLRERAHLFGGSHAQRDVIHQTLAEAALRAGDGALAAALAAERLDLKPRSPFNALLARRADALRGASAAAA